MNKIEAEELLTKLRKQYNDDDEGFEPVTCSEPEARDFLQFIAMEVVGYQHIPKIKKKNYDIIVTIDNIYFKWNNFENQVDDVIYLDLSKDCDADLYYYPFDNECVDDLISEIKIDLEAHKEKIEEITKKKEQAIRFKNKKDKLNKDMEKVKTLLPEKMSFSVDKGSLYHINFSNLTETEFNDVINKLKV